MIRGIPKLCAAIAHFKMVGINRIQNSIEIYAKKTAILPTSPLFCGCLNIDLGLYSIEVSSDYSESIGLFPDGRRIEGSPKVENGSCKEIPGSIHPDLVIDYIKDENSVEVKDEIEYRVYLFPEHENMLESTMNLTRGAR